MMKRWLGIDGFDLVIHTGITAMFMVIVASASPSRFFRSASS